MADLIWAVFIVGGIVALFCGRGADDRRNNRGRWPMNTTASRIVGQPRRRLPPGYVFTGTPEEQFEAVYTLFRPIIESFIVSRLARPDFHLAEDLASECFINLWRWHICRGTTLDDRVFGLLAANARQYLCQHLRRMRSTEVPVDFTDPVVTAARTAQAPAAEVPHLAGLYADLEAAKDELSEAASAYRATRIKAGLAKARLAQVKRPERAARCTANAQRARAAAESALSDFRAAADRVARLRAAWNQAAADCTTSVMEVVQ